MEITTTEKKLIGLDASSSLPYGGVNYKLYPFSGLGADSIKSWTDKRNSLKVTLRNAFGVEFYPGSLNVRLVHGTPWRLPQAHSGRRIRLGVFHVAYALPVILDENCVGIVTAINVRGFDPATGEVLKDPATGEVYAMSLGNDVEMYQIYSPVNIRNRLGVVDRDDVQINARVLSGDLLTVPEYVHHIP